MIGRTRPVRHRTGPPGATEQSRWLQGATAPWMIGLVGALAALLRVVVVGDPTRTVWAEDGLFLQDARASGAASLVDPYNGYLHLPHRTIVLVGSRFPLEAYPWYAVVVGILMLVPLVAFVFICARRLLPATWALLPALSLVLAPPLGNESLATPTAVQFYLLSVCAWALLRPWTGALGRAAVLVALLTGLSSVVAVLLLPLGVLQRSWRASAWLAGGLAVQAIAVMTSDRPARGDGWDKGQLEIVLSLVGGLHRIPELATYWGLLVCVVASVVLGVGRRSRDARLLTLTSLAFLAVTVWVNGGVAGRYVSLAACLVAGALAFASQTAPRRLSWVLLATLATSVLVGFPVSEFRLSGPTWECVDGVAHGAPAGFSDVRCD